MCGIAGFIAAGEDQRDDDSIIRAMADTMVHRGPDGAGYTVLPIDRHDPRKRVALGHRRLKIIDLSEAGRQPMLNAVGTLAITFNGEIYNYLELRDELQRKGRMFRSASDTEVVLEAYSEWGSECFSRFNGMWALAIFDRKSRKLILSRDRFGKKPLYYFETPREFVFASEIKALLRHPAIVAKPNEEKIFRYIARNYRRVDIDDYSFFDGINQIPKSSFVEIDERLNRTTSTYWRIDQSFVREDIGDKEAVQNFRDILYNAVNIRLRSDVPVGCMLSGGMDSTSITSIAYKIFNKRIVAFSGITGEEKGVYDESEYINAVVRETNADFHYIRPEPADIIKTAEEMLRYHDEPVCTVTWYSLYLIAKKIADESVPVILNGHAGDELLAGYWDHYHYHFHDLDRENDPTLAHEIESWKRNHGRDPAEIELYHSYIPEILRNNAWDGRYSDYRFLFRDDVADLYAREVRLDSEYRSLMSRRLYAELLFETVPASLRPEDRNTMSQSIESRSPFLDYQLAEYCFSLPGRFKIRNGLGKWILREAMKGILPEKVRTRRDKSGFIAPADRWFRTFNRDQIYDLFASQSFQGRKLFAQDRVLSMFDEHVRGERNHAMVIWQLINLELWFRRFFDA